MKPRKPPLADAAQQALRERKRVYNRHYRERRRLREGANVGEPSWVACLACRSVFQNMPCYRRAHERGVRHQGRLALMDQDLASPRNLFVEWKVPR